MYIKSFFSLLIMNVVDDEQYDLQAQSISTYIWMYVHQILVNNYIPNTYLHPYHLDYI
jgi:hypothetical protein